jgi:predicted PurR-regulated permease PerM
VTQEEQGERIDLPINIRSAALSAIAVVGVILLLRYAQEVFIPVVLAMLIAYMLNPIVTAATRMRVPRPLAAGVVLLGLVTLSCWGLYALQGQAIAAIDGIQLTAQKVRQKIRDLRQSPGSASTAVGKIQQAAKEIEKTATEATGVPESRGVPKVQLAEPSFRANDYLWMGSVGLIALLSQMVLVLFLVFFLLASGDLYKRKIVKLAGNTLAAKRVTVEAINEINLQIERFLLTQVAVGILVGVCTTAALWGFGLNEPVFWGLASGLVNSVPYFGGIVVTGALAIVAFLQFDSLWMAAAVSGSALAITSLEGFLLTPALLGRATRINGVAMFLSLLFWSWVWGVIGMIVAVPIMIVIKCVCDRIEGLMPIGELLGERDSGAATRSSS